MPDIERGSWSRRSFFRAAGAAAAGAFAMGCTPVRIVLGAYPSRFKQDEGLDDRALLAFVEAVVPGIDTASPHLVRLFADKHYPFAAHRAYFVSDLSRRARQLTGISAFEELSIADRSRVIKQGLAADAITRRLYAGAVFMSQISAYSSAYDDSCGVPMIGFRGHYRFAGLDAVTYPCPEDYLARTLTPTGNPA